MKKLIVVLAYMGALIFVPVASPVSTRGGLACPVMYLKTIAWHPAFSHQTCRGNITPYVYINGHDVTTADMYHNTCTYYGYGAVVRVHQYNNKWISVTAETTNSRTARVRVRVLASP